ncbi:hypothetical protein [Mesorhizobium sp.]|nr:hypothetical protein [Mesorhizobium sp.]
MVKLKDMIPKSGNRFSEKIMANQDMIPKSGNRFSEKIMANQEARV